jgi:hypothetical protein
VGASRRLHPGEHPTLGSALADLHAGRLRVDGVLDTKPGTLAHVSATVARLGDATCTDSLSPQLAPFAVFEDGHLLQLRLAKPGDESAPDGMRTRCPGPTQADTLARGSLAAGRIALARLGSRSLSARLSRPGTFDSGAYVGTRSGALDLQLARVRLSERVVRRKVAR